MRGYFGVTQKVTPAVLLTREFTANAIRQTIRRSLICSPGLYSMRISFGMFLVCLTVLVFAAYSFGYGGLIVAIIAMFLLLQA